MKILHEDGCYTSFCPLSCISWLIEENNNAFFIVLGSMSCSHFMHQPRPLRLSKHPKVATIVLEEEEISLGIRENSLIPLVKEIVGTFNDYKNLFHEQVKGLCENILVTDNSKKVWEMIKKQNPDIILGTLNEKYLASELGIPFIRISLPPQHITTTVFPSETLMGYTGLDILLDKISYIIE